MPPPPDLLVLAAGAFGAPGCDAVVVRDGRIAAVTTRREALAARGPRTRVIDAPRGLLCSGFQDAHAHLVPLARARREIDLHGCGLATIRDAVRAAGARTPAGRWLVGRGFDPEAFRVAGIAPRALLDEAAPGVPVLLRSHDYHSAALNTLGLMRAGFAPSPPEVEGGRVDRDEHGLPNGMLREMAAILATSQTEDLGDDEVAEAVAETLPGLHRAGITCVHDMSGSRAHAPLRILDAGARLSIDLRSVPYSFLALRKKTGDRAETAESERILGRPRIEKGRALVDACGPHGLRALRLVARDDRALFERHEAPEGEALLYRLAVEDGRIRSAERVL